MRILPSLSPFSSLVERESVFLAPAARDDDQSAAPGSPLLPSSSFWRTTEWEPGGVGSSPGVPGRDSFHPRQMNYSAIEGCIFRLFLFPFLSRRKSRQDQLGDLPRRVAARRDRSPPSFFFFFLFFPPSGRAGAERLARRGKADDRVRQSSVGAASVFFSFFFSFPPSVQRIVDSNRPPAKSLLARFGPPPPPPFLETAFRG